MSVDPVLLLCYHEPASLKERRSSTMRAMRRRDRTLLLIVGIPMCVAGFLLIHTGTSEILISFLISIGGSATFRALLDPIFSAIGKERKP